MEVGAMFMQTATNVTEFRRNVSRYVDEVIHDRPALQIRRNRDSILAVNPRFLREALEAYRFTIEYETGEDGRYYGSIDQIPDIIGEGDTVDDLKTDLATYLIDYAQGYWDEYKLFSNAPNRGHHKHYVLRVLMQETIEDVKAMLDA
jgi:predicted RNase H-like HicB family nuclease